MSEMTVSELLRTALDPSTWYSDGSVRKLDAQMAMVAELLQAVYDAADDETRIRMDAIMEKHKRIAREMAP